MSDTTCNLGILANPDFPPDLSGKLTFENHPARQYYEPREDSQMAQWLRAHYLPIISGASGGVGKTLSGLATFIELSAQELRFLGLLIASSTIALGHHSFFEVMRPLSFVTAPIEEKKSLLEFYEQMLPAEVLELASYQEHINGPYGAALIKHLQFEAPVDIDCGKNHQSYV
ncbi:MAG: hypothetical protein JJT82_09535 [Legionellaceae bacterium]|nr:hypothetical protein [Legionellaceae bacterium]